MSKKIPLQNGEYAIIDDEDHEKVNKYNWYVDDNNVLNHQLGSLAKYILDTEKPVVRSGEYLNFKKENLSIGNHKSITQARKGNNSSRSKYKGVSYYKNTKKWAAKVRVDGVLKHIGSFDKEEEAAVAYNEVALYTFGNHAYQNVIGKDNNKDRRKSEKTLVKRNKNGLGRRGVYYDESRNNYQSEIRKDGKRYRLGRFETSEQAAKAYDKKAHELYGDKAILNFPELISEYNKE